MQSPEEETLESIWPIPGTLKALKSTTSSPEKNFVMVRGRKVEMKTVFANNIPMMFYRLDKKRERIEIYGYKADLARALASLFILVFKAEGKVITREQIMNCYCITDNDAYQRTWRLRKMLDKAYPGLSELVQFTVDKKGCYFNPL